MFRYIIIAYVTMTWVLCQPEFDITRILNSYAPTTNNNGKPDPTFEKPVTPSKTVHQDSGTCKCVPYYLCVNGEINYNDRSTKSWVTINKRFNTVCQDSVDVCCKIPKTRTGDGTPPEKPAPEPETRGCGYRNPHGLGVTILTNRTYEAQFGEFPWVVALIDSKATSFIGMGVIIHPQVVMTTAHYGYRYNKSNELIIRAGEWDLKTKKEIYDYQERFVETIYYHSEFVRKSLINDIALLRLQEPLQMAKHINTLCLPDPNENFENSRNCVTNGWGKDLFGPKGQYVHILKEVTYNMIVKDYCEYLMRKTRLKSKFRLHRSFVCGMTAGNFDTCQGDGGAALACPIGNERYKLTGLVAWGIGCGQTGVPTAFTNVSAYRDWIDNKMQEWGFGTSSYTI